MTPVDYWKRPLTTKAPLKKWIPVTFYCDFAWESVFPNSQSEWSRFPGQKIVHEVVLDYLPKTDWANVVVILTTSANEHVVHEECDGTHFFVFDAEKLQERKHTAKGAFLGAAASRAPQVLDIVKEYGSNMEALKGLMLAASAGKTLEGLSATDAVKLLPMALGIMAQALVEDEAGTPKGPAGTLEAREPPNSAKADSGDTDAQPSSERTVKAISPQGPSPRPGLEDGAIAGVNGELKSDSERQSGLDMEIDFEALGRSLQILLARARNRDDVSAVLSALDAIPAEQRGYFAKNPDVVKLVAEQDLRSVELVSWAYRKEQLALFERMLRSSDEVMAYKQFVGTNADGEEPGWQAFFERNRWIFGLALDYFFNEPISKERMEVYSRGFSVFHDGKRPDAFMISTALLRNMCFVEIKTPRKKLMDEIYRTDTWGATRDLAGAVAQSQKAVYRSVAELQDRFRQRDEEGIEFGEPIYSVRPKSYVIIGRLQEFIGDNGGDRSKVFASFELFRRGLVAPEVLTFDELFERAKRLADPTLVKERGQA
jgi:hypothetical protein